MTPTAKREPLAAAIRGRLRRAGSEVLARLRRAPPGALRCPSLRGHVQPLAEAAIPFLAPYFVKGGNRAARSILGALTARRGKSFRPRFEKMGQLPPQIVFNALHPLVSEAVRHLAFAFAASTLATATRDTNTALDLLRKELFGGLEGGEGLLELAARVRAIFDSPRRAVLIARTEAQRAIYSGEVMAARQSGVVKGLRWLAAPACCDVCQSLDGKEVPLGAPFATGTSKNAAYATVYHPPYHPACRCSVQQVIDPRFLP